LAACGERSTAPAPETGADADATAPTSTPAPTSGTVAAPDGAPIAWWRSGGGDTALVFIHGWSCDREFWREQVPAFEDDYTVVTLDLPGHGASGGSRETWRVGDYGADVAAVAEALELDRIVLVGHSMGGLVALAAAAELPGRAIAVVAADSLHDAEIRYPSAETAPMLAAFRADYGQSAAGMFIGMAGTAIDPALSEWIAAEGATSRPEVGIALLEDYVDRDFTPFFREAGVPVRAINAAAGGTIPETRIEANRQYADYDAVILDGVGHFLQLEAPARFNAALREVLAELDAG
jgi:pimeloyl-ACP methyl ester carboxylesterase